MYKVIGADQKEYGPVSADQILNWIPQGRVNADTKIQAEGSAEWKRLGDLPEFAEALGRPAVPPVPGAPPGSAAAGPVATQPPRTSGLAVSSLVLGLLGLLTCGITAVAGLVLGIVGISRINKSQGQLGGKGIAIGGIIISAVFLLMMPVSLAILMPALAKAKQRATTIQCMNNVRQLSLGLILYGNDHNVFPGEKWCDAIKPYIGNSTASFHCVLGKRQYQSHYAFNSALAGMAPNDIKDPAHVVMVFEIEGGWNVSGGKELLPRTGRHDAGYMFGFADGHSEIVKPARLANLRWEPQRSGETEL